MALGSNQLNQGRGSFLRIDEIIFFTTKLVRNYFYQYDLSCMVFYKRDIVFLIKIRAILFISASIYAFPPPLDLTISS